MRQIRPPGQLARRQNHSSRHTSGCPEPTALVVRSSAARPAAAASQSIACNYTQLNQAASPPPSSSSSPPPQPPPIQRDSTIQVQDGCQLQRQPAGRSNKAAQFGWRQRRELRKPETKAERQTSQSFGSPASQPADPFGRKLAACSQLAGRPAAAPAPPPQVESPPPLVCAGRSR